MVTRRVAAVAAAGVACLLLLTVALQSQLSGPPTSELSSGSSLSAKEERQLGALIGSVVGETATAHRGHAARSARHSDTKLGAWVHKREAQDGGLVAYPTERLSGSKLTKAEQFAAGQTTCGADCMKALAQRVAHPPKLPSATLGGALAAKEAELGDTNEKPTGGAYDVGEERVRRAAAKEQNAEEKSAFVKAQEKRMDAEVQAGWTALGKKDASGATAHLSQARHYHKAMLRLLRGSPDMTAHLATPREIKGLRDAIQSASSDRIPGIPKQLAEIMDTKSLSSHTGGKPKAEDDADGGQGMPKKLAAIMDKDFTDAGSGTGGGDLAKIEKHFGSSVTLPADKAATSPLVGAGFAKLAQQAIKDGKEAMDHGKLAEARHAESKARIYLISVAESAKHGDATDEKALGSLKLESNILAHAVKNLATSRDRLQQAQLATNLKTLHAPIQQESLSDFATSPSQRAAKKAAAESRLESDRVRFEAAVRTGVKDAHKDNIGEAQHKLVQARLYAQREGLLERAADVQKGDAANARIAKQALKMLARNIVRAEQGLVEGSAPARSRPRDYGPGSREDQAAFGGKRGGRGRGRGRGGVGNRGRAGGKTKVVKWEDDYSHHLGDDTSANGEANQERRDERKADRTQQADCNSLSCLFAKVNEDRASDHLGGSDMPEMPGGDDLSRRDFGHAHTKMHSGMHMGFRLKQKYHKSGGGVSHDPLRRVPNGGDVVAPDRGRGQTDATDTKNSRDLTHRSARAGGSTMGDDALPDVAGVSVRVSGKMARTEEATELKHSMKEAMTDYQALLRREVKKEEGRAFTIPHLAISSPRGAPNLAHLSGVGANPAGVTLSSLTHRTTSKGPLPGELASASGPETGAGGAGGAEGLMKQLLHKATFRGGPWDEQESSQDVHNAADRPLLPASSAAAAPAFAGLAGKTGGLGQYIAASNVEEAREDKAAAVQDDARREAARIARVAGGGEAQGHFAAKTETPAEEDAEARQLREEREARDAYDRQQAVRRGLQERSRHFHQSLQQAKPLDMAGILVHDISKDLGF